MYDISVVTPSYNQGSFIEQTLLSVLQQDGVSVQYIVVDGASTDGTHEVLEKYADKLDTLIVESDEGQADALRKGFSQAKGEICCYLNSDDYLLPGALQEVVAWFNDHPNTDLIYGHRIFVDGEDQFLKYWILPPHSNYLMERWDYIPQETAFWRRSAMRRAGGIDPEMRFAMDYDLFARMMRDGARFTRLNRFFAVFRQHENSKTTTLMQTVGMEEVELVRTRYGICIHRLDGLVAMLLHACIVIASGLYRLVAGRPQKL